MADLYLYIYKTTPNILLLLFSFICSRSYLEFSIFFLSLRSDTYIKYHYIILKIKFQGSDFN